MTIREIDSEISRLKALRREAEKKERDKYLSKARQFVGKCYRRKNGSVFKIVGVPIQYSHMTGVVFNEYQFPTIFLKYHNPVRDVYIRGDFEGFEPIYCEEIYFNINSQGHIPSICGDEYIEITQEEFAAEFDKCIAAYKKQVGM